MEKVSECEKRLEYLQELKYFLEEAKTKDDILSVQKELNIFSAKGICIRNFQEESFSQ